MPRFDAQTIARIHESHSLGVRSGDTHKFTFIWVVVIKGRILARSWNDKPGGWFRAFLKHPTGAIRFGKKEIPARGARVRSAALINAMHAAYAEKYPHKGSQQYVVGFRTGKRKAATMEFVPLT